MENNKISPEKRQEFKEADANKIILQHLIVEVKETIDQTLAANPNSQSPKELIKNIRRSLELLENGLDPYLVNLTPEQIVEYTSSPTYKYSAEVWSKYKTALQEKPLK